MKKNLLQWIFPIFLIASAVSEGATCPHTCYRHANNRKPCEKLGPFVECSPMLRPLVGELMQLPEVRKLFAEVEREGAIRLYHNNHPSMQFGALWDGSHRVIIVNTTRGRSRGDMLASILFEMHNAAANTQFERLDRMALAGQISRRNYIESTERIEHSNALSCTNIMRKGISMGIFPQDSLHAVPRSFTEYFAIQQKYGHSACIGSMYDSLVR